MALRITEPNHTGDDLNTHKHEFQIEQALTTCPHDSCTRHTLRNRRLCWAVAFNSLVKFGEAAWAASMDTVTEWLR